MEGSSAGRNLPLGTERYHEERQLGQSVAWPSYDPITSRIQFRSVASSASLLCAVTSRELSLWEFPGWGASSGLA
jgi:hypothetical protein